MTTANPHDDQPLPEGTESADVTSDDVVVNLQDATAQPLPSGDARIAELEAKLAESNDRALRAIAEADNTRKRLEKERQDTAKYAISGFARDLLAVADNMRRALQAITPEQQDKNPELKTIYVGVEMTERVLMQLFEKNGIKKIEPLGQTFDPNLHEVIFESEIPGQQAGTIIQVVEAGYTIHDRLLRPARVGVAKGDASLEGGARLDTSA